MAFIKKLLMLQLVLAACAICATAYPRFVDELPNLPTVGGESWRGVGHTNRGGGGPRNPFGLDFKAAGTKWTAELCKKDSDGDGFTNGQELGDPSCTWVKGMPNPKVPRGIHPALSPWSASLHPSNPLTAAQPSAKRQCAEGDQSVLQVLQAVKTV